MTVKPVLILSYYAEAFLNTLDLSNYFTIVTATAPTNLATPAASMAANQAAVAAAVDALPAGTKFAFAGLSYGAWTVSKFYEENIKTGPRTSRAPDFLGAVTAGNPMREAGKVFPGCPDPGGHGIASTRMASTPSKWWNFAAPGDVIAVNMDNTEGDLQAAIFAWIYADYAGAGDLWAAAQAEFNSVPALQVASIVNLVYSGLTWSYPHMTYAIQTPIVGDNRNIATIAGDYLKVLAASAPAPTKVITVGGGSLLNKFLGWVTGGKVVLPFGQSDWTLFPDGTAFDVMVDDLNAMILATSGDDIVLFGYGFGAVAVQSWLKRYGPTSTVGPDRISQVVLASNPGRREGGILRDTGIDLIPTDTRYRVLDVKRQYDGWADWPDRSEVPDLVDLSFDNIIQALAGVGTTAGQNALIGMAMSYDNVNVAADEFFEVAEGNITYRVYTTYPCPITEFKYPLGLFVSSYLSTMDAKVRPMIEIKYDRIEGTPKIIPLGGITSLEDSERIWNIAMAKRALKEKRRLVPAQIRLWDGDGVLRGEVAGWRDYDYEIVENDTGVASLELPLDHYLARWVMDFRGRAKRNVLITFDKQGYRWSGFMDNYKVVHSKDFDRYLVISFKHDYEQAKHILCWSNPFLRPEVQFPKLWVIFGPAKWCLLVTLFVNIMRLETSLWTLPDNPLDIRSWIPFSFDPSTWRNIVKPFPFLADNSNLTIVFARFKPIHDVWKKDLQDAQLTVVCRRYIEGEDPHPFSDLQGELDIDFVEDLFSLIPLRHFVLVWDIVDKSGWGTETAFGGSLLTGLIRAVVNIASDGVTEGVDIFTGDPTFPGEYYTPNFLGTSPRAPHVVYPDSMFTGITESEFTYFEATDTSFLAGGHSAPGINEAFSAGVNMAGDFLTSIINTIISEVGAIGVGAGAFGAITASVPSIDIPPLGGIMDAVAKILYEDTFFAFMEVSTLRASSINIPLTGLEALGTSLGDLHYYEGWADGADRAFTLSAFMAVRAKIWATRARTVHTITVADAAPYVFGEKGYGDFGIGDRIGTTFREFPVANTIFMERVSKAKHGWGKDGSRGWKFTVGWNEPLDPAFKALDQVKEVNQALSTFGIL